MISISISISIRITVFNWNEFFNRNYVGFLKKNYYYYYYYYYYFYCQFARFSWSGDLIPVTLGIHRLSYNSWCCHTVNKFFVMVEYFRRVLLSLDTYGIFHWLFRGHQWRSVQAQRLLDDLFDDQMGKRYHYCYKQKRDGALCTLLCVTEKIAFWQLIKREPVSGQLRRMTNSPPWTWKKRLSQVVAK